MFVSSFIVDLFYSKEYLEKVISVFSPTKLQHFFHTSKKNMHKKTFLRTKKPKLCIFITKYLGNTQKNTTFAAVFVPNWTIHVRIFELEEDNLSTEH